MTVVEIFDSIQGEGRWMGIMRTFVRFAGCNLKCPFCDEAKKYGDQKEMTVDEIVAACKQHGVVLTGGEPTIQADLDELITALRFEGHAVAIETNGTNEVTSQGIWVTCSPKAPDYKVCTHDEIKLVVDEHLTFEEAKEIAEAENDFVWLQPCDGPWLEESKKRIIDWIAKEPNLFRAGIQLHKYYNER